MNSFSLSVNLSGAGFISVKNQISRLRYALVAGFVPAVLAIVGVYALSKLTATPVNWLTRDPADVTKTGFYIGVLSYLGIMLWSAATATCFLAAYLLSRHKGLRQPMIFMLLSGVLSMGLAFDDAFMLHERVFPRHLHIPEIVIFGAYLVICVGYGVYFFRRILLTDYLLLALALFFLGLSAGMDQVLTFSNLETFMEDSLKFFGIVFWVIYFARTAAATIQNSLVSENAPP